MELPRSAEEWYREQLDAAQKHQNMPFVYRAHVSLGLLRLDLAEATTIELVKKEELDEAGVHFFRAHEALDAYEAVIEAGLMASGRRRELKQLRAEARLNDGRLLVLRGEFEMALSKLTVVLEAAQEVSDELLRFQTLGLMGRAYTGLGEHTSAIEKCFDLQLSLARNMQDAELEAEALFNLALAYRDLRDFDLALNTLYLYKDYLKMQMLDQRKLDTADELIVETLDLKETAESVVRIEMKLPLLTNPEKHLLRLSRDCRKLGIVQDAMMYACQLVEGQLSTGEFDDKSLLLAAELCIERKRADDAIFYCKKLLEALELHRGAQDKARVDAFLLLAEAYWLLPTLPGEILHILHRTLDICREKMLKDRELRTLSKLALSCAKLGIDDDHLRFKEECLHKWNAQCLAEDGDKIVESQKQKQELDNLDYFANRKPSKNVMRLVDGQFNLKSRSKTHVKGLEIKKSRRPRDRDASKPPAGRAPRRTRTHALLGDDDGNDLAEFIVDDEAQPSDLGPKRALGSQHRQASRRRGVDPFLRDPSRNYGPQTMKKHLRIEDSDDETASVPTKGPATATCTGENLYDEPMLGDDVPWSDSSPPPQRPAMIEDRSAAYNRSAGEPRSAWSGDPGVIASVLRLTVVIDGEALVVPVVDDIAERKTIAWLINECMRRFEAEFSRSPMIEAILTDRGARLGANDPISLVLADGEQVHARVVGYRKKSLLQWYEETCLECGIAVVASLRELVQKQEQSAIDLSHWCWEESQLEMVVRALCRYAGTFPGEKLPVATLNLSNNPLLTDEAVARLVRLVTDHVSAIDLSFTNIRRSVYIVESCPRLERIGLSFCGALSDVPMLIRTMAQRGFDSLLRTVDLAGLSLVGTQALLGDLHYLNGLEALNLSFGRLDAEAGGGLGGLLRRSMSLKRLDLRGCVADDEALQPVVESLAFNFFLRELLLEGSQMSEELTAQLSDVVRANSKSALRPCAM